MWNAPNKNQKNAARRRERARRAIHLKRITATLTSRSQSSQPTEDANGMAVRLLLNDLSVKGVGLYSTHPFPVGHEVNLAITEPMRLDIPGRVAWSQEFGSTSHILSKHPYSYRMGIEFVLSPTEEQTVQIFCDEVLRDYLFTVK